MVNNSRSFGVLGEDTTFFSNNVDFSNTVDDKKVYYLIGKSSLTIDSALCPDLGALVLVNCSGVTVQNLSLSNIYGGIHLVNAENSVVTNNTVTDSAGGVLLQFSNNCTISKNIVIQTSYNDEALGIISNFGISVENSENILVLENYVEQNEHESPLISMLSSSNCTIAGNTLQNPLYYTFPIGIYLQSTNNTNINNNTQIGTNGTMDGIYLDRSLNNTVQSNTFGKAGIRITQQSNFNSILENNFGGLYLYEGYFNNITDNMVHSDIGLTLFNGENNFIARNVITSGERAIKLFNFNHNIFQKNVFLGVSYIEDWGSTVGDSVSTNVWL